MKVSSQRQSRHIKLRRRLISQLDSSPRNISTYRMFHSREFDELCHYYIEGCGIHQFEEFVSYAMRLEASLK